ncbi:MAG: hypothetical protein ABIM98_04100 [candidate division WOR-3 bacterium]
MIKFLLFPSTLFIFFNLKNYYIKVFPPDTLNFEKPFNFVDVKTDGLFIYFLTRDGKVKSINPYNGTLKSEFKINSLLYALYFDVTDRGNFYFFISKGGTSKILKIKFSPFDTTVYYYDIDKNLFDFFCIDDSFFIFVFKDRISVYKNGKLTKIFKKNYKNYFKYKNSFYVYSGDTLFSLLMGEKKEYKGSYDFLFIIDKGEIVNKDNKWFLKN